MARPLVAAILFDSVWGGEPPTPPVGKSDPVIDWRELRRLLDDNGYRDVRITTERDGSIRLG